MSERQFDTVLRYLRKLTGGPEPSAQTDGLLLERYLAARDQGAFEELVQRHAVLVHGVCRRVLRNAHDADDAFQATFMVLARKAGSIRKPEALVGWLYGVAYHIALKARAEAGRRRERERQVAAVKETGPTAESAWCDLEPFLDEELQRLPAKYRLVLIRCYLDGKSNREAAQELGWPSGSMARRLDRARTLLRQRLESRGVALPAALFAAALARPASAMIADALVSSAARAGLQFASGASGGLEASSQAAAWADGAIQAMGVNKMKLTLTVAIVLGVTGLGGAAIHHILSAAPRELPAAGPAVVANDGPPALPVRIDVFGDPLPAGAIARIGTIRWRHGRSDSSEAGALAFAPDGKTIASMGNGRIYLWETATGKLLRDLASDNFLAHALTFASDGKTLASAGSQAVQLWDVATGRMLLRRGERKENDGPGLGAAAVALSPDAKIMAAYLTGDKAIHLWDTAGGKELKKLEGHELPVRRLVFSADGKTLTSLSQDVQLCVWDVAAGKALKQHGGLDRAFGFVNLSPDGKTYAYADVEKNTLQLLSTATGQTIRTMRGYEAHFSPDGKTLATGAGKLILSDLASGKEILPKGEQAFEDFPGFSPTAFSLDGKTLAVADFNASHILLWDVATGKKLRYAPGQSPDDVAFTPDGKELMTRDEDGQHLHFWDPTSGKEIRWQKLPEGAVLVFPDGMSRLYPQFGIQRKRTIDACRLWDAVRNKELLKVEGDDYLASALSPDGKRLALQRGGQPVRMLTVPDMKELWALKANPNVEEGDTAGDLSFSPDGRKLITTTKGLVHVLDAATGKELYKVPNPAENVVPFAKLSSDNRVLAIERLDGEPIVLWDVVNDHRIGELREAEQIPGEGSRLAFSPDGRLLACMSSLGAGACVFETSTCKLRQVIYEGHHANLAALGFSPDGKMLTTTSPDGTVLSWDLADPRLIGRADTPKKPLSLPRSDADLRELWNDLAGEDPAGAARAILGLARAPALTVPFLKDRMKAQALDRQKLAQWVSGLKSDQFDPRQAAVRELEKLGELAIPALKEAQTSQPSLELQQRVEQLLEKAYGPLQPGTTLQIVRGIEVLERIGSPAARQVLEPLAKGVPESRVTRAAESALARLSR